MVAAALQGHCEKLYSEDFQHGRKIPDMRIENPFATRRNPTSFFIPLDSILEVTLCRRSIFSPRSAHRLENLVDHWRRERRRTWGL